jgi:uncharacterized protein YwgA
MSSARFKVQRLVFPTMERLDLLALAFYLSGGRIKGLTRLHKIVFLLQEEFGLRGYEFTPSKYGPWSRDLAEDVERLIGEGLIGVEEFSDPVYSFMQENPAKLLVASHSLLERGRAVFERMYLENKLLALEMRRRVRSYSAVPITYLLAYVYKKYPSYASNSVIRERVESWKRVYELKTTGRR